MMIGRQIDDRALDAGAGRRRHPDRQVEAETGEDPLEVAAPADGDGHRPDGVLEDEVPADHPGEDLAERGVSVGVGAAGDRNHRRELGIAERGKRARQTREHVRQHDGRARLVGRGRAGQDEDAGPDDRADAEQCQVHRRQRPLERLGAALRVSDQLLDRLGLQEIRVHSPSRKVGTRDLRFGRRDAAVLAVSSPASAEKRRQYTLNGCGGRRGVRTARTRASGRPRQACRR